MDDSILADNEVSETVLSVERALLILKRLADSKEEFGVRDLSRELGYSPAVTQKILNTLRIHGFVRQNDKTERYTLGPTALQVGMAVLSQLDVVRIARPFMEKLTEKTGETTFLAILEDTHAIYIDKEVSANPVRMDAEVGVSRPLNCTAVGKVLLAYGSKEFVSKVAQQGAFIQSTPNSIVNPAQLEKELERVRQIGYAVDNREFHSEAICVASPIFSADGRVLAAITTSGVATRMEQHPAKYADVVKEVAAQISAELGYRT